MRTVNRIARVRRAVGGSSPPPPPLSVGVTWNAGNLATGNLTLTGNATGGTGSYSYSWSIAGPSSLADSWPAGFEFLGNNVAVRFNQRSLWTGENPATATTATPPTANMTVPPLEPTAFDATGPFEMLYGGYQVTLSVSDGSTTANETLSLEIHDEGISANYTQAPEIQDTVTYDVTVTGETETGNGEISFSNITVPAGATHWVAYKFGADQSGVVYVNEASETTFSTGQTQAAQDYLFVVWAFGPGRNGPPTVSGPYTVDPA